MSNTKRGAFATSELEFIQSNCLTMTPIDIAKALNRDIKGIRKKIDAAKNNVLVKTEETGGAEHELKNKPYWQEIQRAYSERELKIYIHHWSKLMTQFRDDITHTEEMQILKVIDIELLVFRNLIDRQNVDEQIVNLEKEILDLMMQEEKDQIIINMRNQVVALKASQQARSTEYNNMVAKQQAMMRDLKSTRDQRLEKIETGKATFFSLLKLFSDEQTRKQYSHEAELMKLAMEKSRKDLSEYHKYEDGMVDQPFLNADTIKEDNK